MSKSTYCEIDLQVKAGETVISHFLNKLAPNY